MVEGGITEERDELESGLVVSLVEEDVPEEGQFLSGVQILAQSLLHLDSLGMESLGPEVTDH